MKKFLTFLLFIFFSSLGFTQQGVNDPTFNIEDSLTHKNGPSGRVNTLFRQNNGKILVGGSFLTYNNDTVNSIVRIDSLGLKDNSFNTGLGFTKLNTFGYIGKIKEFSNGRIIVTGNFSFYNGEPCDNIIALHNDGSIDTTFDIRFKFDGSVYDFIEQPDGKIVFAGNFNSFDGDYSSKIVRLNIDGTQDTTFQTPDFFGYTNQNYSLAIQSDNKIIITASAIKGVNDTLKFITRLFEDGQIDTTFNSSWINLASFYKIHFLPNGKILIGTDQQGIIRLNSDGTKDISFASNQQSPLIEMRRVADFVVNSNNEIIINGINFTDYTLNNGICYARLDSNGFVIPSSIVESNMFLWGNAIVLMPDGGVLLGSSTSYYNDQLKPFLVSVDTNGVINEWFNSHKGFDDKVYDICVLPDDKILVGGVFKLYNNVFKKGIVRLFPNGEIDTTFTISNVIVGSVSSISYHSSGKIVLGGNFSVNNQSTNIIRFNLDGSLDTTFITGLGFDDAVTKVHALSNGQVLVAGKFIKYNNITIKGMAKLNVDGSLDTTFALAYNGISLEPLYGVSDFDFQSDGKIIVGGSFSMGYYSYLNHLVRFFPNGEYDENFVAAGTTEPYSPSFAHIKKVIVQSDDKIIVGGSFSKYNNNYSPGIIRLQSNGLVDSTYQVQDGFNIGSIYDNVVNDIFKYPNDNIVVVGQFTTYNNSTAKNIIKINSDGTIDNSFTTVGADNEINAIGIQTSGKLIIGGTFSLYDGSIRNKIARVFAYPISVDEFDENQLNFIIYPNPINYGELSIKTISKNSYNIIIFDVNGREILHQKNLYNNSKINISGFISGLYTAKITYEDKVEVKKILITR